MENTVSLTINNETFTVPFKTSPNTPEGIEKMQKEIVNAAHEVMNSYFFAHNMGRYANSKK